MTMIRNLLLAAVWAATLAACSAAPPSKTGADTDPVTLSVVSYTTNALTGDTTTRLMDEVTRAGADVVLSAAPPLDAGTTDGSSDAVTAVREGRVDVAVVAARSFDLAGVTSLQALAAPLAVRSPEQAALFLADPFAADMLGGLTTTGIVGLALTYDSLTQPLGFSAPVREPGDLAHARVLVRPSRATEAFITALGGSADPRNGDDAATAVAGGEVTAAVASMDRPSGFQAGPAGSTSAITGNVQLTIKANAIIVNATVWAGLTPHQQTTLTTAAANARTWAATQAVRLDGAAAAFCAQHIGDVVIADDAQLQRWQAAAAPVIADLSRDPITAAALARLADIVAEHPSSDIPVACTAAPIAATSSPAAVSDPSAIQGQWRLAVTADNMTATGASAQSAVVNQGTWTFVFRADGSYSYVDPRQRTCPGNFTLAADRLSMTEDATVRDCDGQWDFTVVRTGDDLALTPTRDFAAILGGEVGFFTNPLIRIGDVPAP